MSDFDQFITEMGITHQRLAVSKATIPRPAKTERELVEPRPSKIEGEGAFATQSFAAGDLIAPIRENGAWTLTGLLVNHAFDPNAIFEADELIALKPIDLGEEITLNYRQVRDKLYA